MIRFIPTYFYDDQLLQSETFSLITLKWRSLFTPFFKCSKKTSLGHRRTWDVYYPAIFLGIITSHYKDPGSPLHKRCRLFMALAGQQAQRFLANFFGFRESRGPRFRAFIPAPSKGCHKWFRYRVSPFTIPWLIILGDFRNDDIHC